MINILVADDHTLLREALTKFLKDQPDMKILAEAKSTDEVIELVKKKLFDIILLDITMPPGKCGLDIIKDIKRYNKNTHVLVLTMHCENDFAFRAFKAGASGYITKDKSSTDLIKAIRRVISGGKYISPEFAEQLANEIKGENYRSEYYKLSDREFQILIMIASGKKVTEIANELNLCKATINTYRARILEKLNLRGNVDMTHYAINNNLL